MQGPPWVVSDARNGIFVDVILPIHKKAAEKHLGKNMVIVITLKLVVTESLIVIVQE